jgi:hypothetical protein
MDFLQSPQYLASLASTVGQRRSYAMWLVGVGVLSTTLALLSMEMTRDPLISAVCAAALAIWSCIQTAGAALGTSAWFLLISATMSLGIAQAFFFVRTDMVKQLAIAFAATPPSPAHGKQALAWARENSRGLWWAFAGCIAMTILAVFSACFSDAPGTLLAAAVLVVSNLVALFWREDGNVPAFDLASRAVQSCEAMGGWRYKASHKEWFVAPSGIAWLQAMSAANLIDLSQPAGQEAFVNALTRNCADTNGHAQALALELEAALRAPALRVEPGATTK